MASQPPPNGPGRGVSQLYPTPPVLGRGSQAPPADTPAPGVSQLYPSIGASHAQTLKAPSKAPSVSASSQSRQPSVRPSQVHPQLASIRASQAPSHQPSVKPSHAATLRGPSQAPSRQPSIKPPYAATLRGPSQAPVPQTSTRVASQYHTTSSRMPNGEPSMMANSCATELKRDVPQLPTIMLQAPSDHKTLSQRDTTIITQSTLLQRDAYKMPSSTPTTKEASKAPTITPSKKFQNLPSVRSILHSPTDIQMASRQSTINKMKGAERKAQDNWALGKLGKLDTGCPQNYGWSRRSDGYICDGGSHYITDLLLVEGMGGMFVVKDKNHWQDRSQGPYYWAGKNDQGKNLFMKVTDHKMG
ncbi:c3f628d4-6d40-4b7a-865d-7474f3e26164-CDS [Sclerotinia trifoliorum]|uniref:C3f628d4-6d40-4b7a-865d-7474f3e26164-CDS n=1 Tax=Sclerotinia trifoliorum TaxID=28548 RepID=A0A8H2VWH2_9HELO|nr:c3f628d4-6d40-4b7a-865d-7474f3e26164-CDS [Sclerotinia trifoliorum]